MKTKNEETQDVPCDHPCDVLNDLAKEVDELKETVFDYTQAIGGEMEINISLMAEMDRLKERIKELEDGNEFLKSTVDGYIKAGEALARERDRYKKALESASCELGSVIPEKDCKCHQNPPCNWCYEWGLYADLVSDMKKALGGE